MFKFPAAVFRRLSAKHRRFRILKFRFFSKYPPPFSWPAARIDTEENASTRFRGCLKKASGIVEGILSKLL